MQESILGIDRGGSFTDCVALADKKIVFRYSRSTAEFNETEFKKALEQKKLKPVGVCITGKKKTSGFSNRRMVDELKSTATGAQFLSNQKRFLVASLGTGTALLEFENGKITHAGGTGVGGGTLEGLSRLLLQLDVVSAHALALNGKPALDLTVQDVVGAGIGNLPGNATASNFGKQNENASKENVAFSLFNMVAETGGVCACLAAEKNGFEKIVFVGRTSTFSLIQKRLETTCQLFNKKAVFPTDAEYATAIGAALQYKQ